MSSSNTNSYTISLSIFIKQLMYQVVELILYVNIKNIDYIVLFMSVVIWILHIFYIRWIIICIWFNVPSLALFYNFWKEKHIKCDGLANRTNKIYAICINVSSNGSFGKRAGFYKRRQYQEQHKILWKNSIKQTYLFRSDYVPTYHFPSSLLQYTKSNMI